MYTKAFKFVNIFLTIFVCLIWSICSLADGSLSSRRQTQSVDARVEAIRALPLLRQVERGTQSVEELQTFLREELDRTYPGSALQTIEKRLLTFGFVTRPIHLKELFFTLFSQQIAGYYDPLKKKMVLIQGTSGQHLPSILELWSRMVMRRIGVSLDEVLLAHELTHVLQDQHFDLLSLPFEELGQEDRATAVRSLIEGDATVVMIDYMLRVQGIDATQVPDLSASMRWWATNPLVQSTTVFQGLPRYVLENLLFPYLYGLNFVLDLKRHGGWERVDRAYKDYPVSTEQILHPEKYWKERDWPTIIQLPPLAPLSPQWRVLEENTLGEFNIRLLLDGYLPAAQARTASAGWDGDRFLLYEHTGSQQRILAWYTTWDSEIDAREFLHACSKMLKKQAGFRNETDPPFPRSQSEEFPLRLQRQDGRSILLDRRGQDVVFLDGVPERVGQDVFSLFWEQSRKTCMTAADL